MKQCTVDVELDVYDLANEFVGIGSVDQARFFNLIAERFSDWRPGDADAQFREIAYELVSASSNTEKGIEWLRRLVAVIDDNEERDPVNGQPVSGRAGGT